MASLYSTSDSRTFGLRLSGIYARMDSSTPLQLISTLELPQGQQLQLQCEVTKGPQANNTSAVSNYNYQLLLNSQVGYPIKVSAKILQKQEGLQRAELSPDLANGILTSILPGVPLPLVNIGYFANDELDQTFTQPPTDVTLLLTAHFTPLPKEADQTCKSEQVGQMRSHIKQLGSLLATGNFADCKVVSKDGKVHNCHKTLLCLKSEEFKRAFEAEDTVEGVQIDCEDAVVVLLLHYFYTGQSPKVAQDSAMGLYLGAHKYITGGPYQLVSLSNVLDWVVFAEKFGLNDFMQFCMEFIKGNQSALLSLPDWEAFRSANPRLIDQLLLQCGRSD